MNHWLRAALQAAVGLGLLGAVVHLLGTGPFRQALGALTPVTALAALVLGGMATTAQALRWRSVVGARGSAGGGGPVLPVGTAVGEYYRAGVLNAVLPGGLAGDVLRVHRTRRRGGWLSSAASVLVERLAGTALLLVVGAGVLLAVVDGVSGGWALGLTAVAVVLAVVVIRAVGPAPATTHLAVWGWSALALAALVALFAVASVAVVTSDGGPLDGAGADDPGGTGTAVLAVLALLGMSLPVGVGGFGPREAIAAAAAGSAGTTPETAVAITAGYGVLAVVSSAPGLVLLLLDLLRPGRGTSGGSPAEEDP